MTSRRLLLPLVLVPVLAASDPRPLKVDDLFLLKDVKDPQMSPDGKWVAYTVSSLDPSKDESNSDIYMSPIGGGEALRLTTSPKPAKSPRFSPDGKYLAFLSARDGKKTQVWLLNRAGGEAQKLTDYKAAVSSLAWSPDGTHLALVVADVDPDDADGEANGQDKEKKTPKPIVIHRRQFMRDGEGYLREFRNHVYVFDVQKRTSVQVTSGPYDDSDPAWSPDGRWIAFTSNRTPDPDSNQNSDIFVVPSRPGESPRALATSPGTDGSPTFSPDGKLVAYVEGGDPKDMWYGTSRIAVVPVSGGPSRSLTPSLDRNVLAPKFSTDGEAILFVAEDGGNQSLLKVSAAGGPVERVIGGERVIEAFDVGRRGEIVVLETQPQQPPEVSGFVGGALKRVTTVNDAVLKQIRLGTVERFKARSKDGTVVDGFLTRPPNAPQGKLPTILRIHGGPTSQYSTEFNFQWQVLASQGYAVVAANPRGSAGYGREFARAIWADWGNKDLDDLLAVVDHVTAMGVADPDRLGVGGWSYGGILTDNIITKSTRFKAAISGASEANYLADYGTDHYQYEWETELGLPWKNTDLWLRLSPFFMVENVKTPTLFLCGSADMNVPLLNSEQLYQALKRLGVETELVIYPDETHSIDKPSYQKDRLERYIAWYDRFLKDKPANVSAAP